MAVKQVLIRRGEVVVEQVPAPIVESGTVLVRVHYSCISPGTESAVLQASGHSLWQHLRADPERIRKLAALVRRGGIRRIRLAADDVRRRIHPLGYSVAGIVTDIGPGVEGVRVGDRVAAAGDQYAYHAEIIRVPTNLLAVVPSALGLAEASTVALGAVALQSLRRAEPALGEAFVVIGLGIIGQLVAQLLKASGCRVIGIDLDPHRVQVGLKHGLDAAVDPAVKQAGRQVLQLTGGMGADGAIVTARGRSRHAIAVALAVCRRGGRIVVVGDVDLHLDRSVFYQKELEVRMSTSYGPGRYDPEYEGRGIDYPPAYVRWTAKRNMEEYLALLAARKVTVEPLLAAIYPIEEAARAYADLRTRVPRPLGILLSYSTQVSAGEKRRIENPTVLRLAGSRVRLALVGAGAFAQAEHLPNLLRSAPTLSLRAIVSRHGHSAMAAARRFGAAYATTDLRQVWDDPDVDAVLIATRHNLHAQLALEALKAGKHVLVEKPLAITTNELEAIADFYRSHEGAGAPILLTGFNRRFAPLSQRLRELLADRRGPMMIMYRFHTDPLPSNHWIYGPEGGGRNLGEACHAYDLFTFLTGARVHRVQAQALCGPERSRVATDNFSAMLDFSDGSIATLIYTSLGSVGDSKELLEVYVDDEAFVLEDFRVLRARDGNRLRTWRSRSKGHWEELDAFVKAVRDAAEWPIPLWQQVQATEIALQVEAAMRIS